MKAPSPVLPLLALLVLAGPGAAGAQSAASGLLYERALMARAGGRCALFAPAVATALAAARDQARGAALRAGDAPAAVAALEGRAQARGASVPCRSPGLQQAAARVRQAFADYAALSVMRFPGPRSAWRAERPDPRLKGQRWTLVQALPGSGGWLLFGLADGTPALLDARRGVGPAAFARITLRDPGRMAGPDLMGPPPGASRTVFAATRTAAARTLWPAGATGGVLYSFPPPLPGELAALDPRETARVELVYSRPGGAERVQAATLEVGDLAAALAFLRSGAPRPRS